MPTYDEPLRAARHILSLLAAFAMSLAWLIPNHYPPWRSFYNDGCMGVALILLGAAQLLTRQRKPVPAIAWIVISLAILPWLQLSSGLLKYSGDAWVATLYLSGFGLAIVVGYWESFSSAKRLALLLALPAVAAAVVSSLIACVQVLHGSVLGIWSIDVRSAMQGEGNLAQANNLATLIGFGAIGVLVLFEQKLVSRAFGSAIALLLALGAGLTQSRTALLFGPAVILLMLYFRHRDPNLLTTRLRTVVGVTGVHWIIAFGWPIVRDSMLLGGIPAFAERGFQSGRFGAWYAFFEAMKEAPWLGYGWLQASSAQLAVADHVPVVGELYSEAHNLFLDLIVWCGYPLGLLLSGCVVVWFLSRLRRVSSVESVAGLLTVSLLLIHSMLELPHQYAYFLLPAGLWLGLIEHSVKAGSVQSPRLAIAAMACTCLLFFNIAFEYLVIEDDFRLARFEYFRIGSIHAAARAPDAPLLSNLRAYAGFYRFTPAAGLEANDLTDLRTITERYPTTYLLYGYAATLALNDQPAEARRIFTNIRQLYGESAYDALKEDLRHRAEDSKQNRLQLLVASLP